MRTNPYNHLKECCRKEFSKIIYRKRVLLWTYSKENINTTWSLSELAHRVKAADQLGFDVRLISNEDGGLRVEYISKVITDMPWWL
jgi:hypothetical protein